jgi:hypothetical protein
METKGAALLAGKLRRPLARTRCCKKIGDDQNYLWEKIKKKMVLCNYRIEVMLIYILIPGNICFYLDAKNI